MTVRTQEASQAWQVDMPAQGVTRRFLLMLFAGSFFLGAGVLFTYVMVWAPVQWQPERPPLVLVFVLPVPAMVMGALVIFLAISSAADRVTVVADGGALRVTRRGLLVRRRVELQRADLLDLGLRIRYGNSDEMSQATVVARLAGGRRKTLFTRYGAAEARRVRDALQAVLWPERLDAAQRFSPPAGGCLVAAAEGQGVRVHMGPERVGQVLQGVYYMGLAFLFGAPCFVGLLVVIGLQAARDAGTRIAAPVAGALIAAVLAGVGAAMVIWARRTALRQADIQITPGELRIDITGPGDPEHHVWPASQIHAVRVAASHTSVNQQPTMEFSVMTRDGKNQQLFNGRDQEDLEWLAGTIETVLSLSDPGKRREELLASLPAAPAANAPGATEPRGLAEQIDSLLHGSTLRRVADEGALVLEIGPAGLRRAPLTLIFFAVVAWLVHLLFVILGVLLWTQTTAATWIFFGLLTVFDLGMALCLRRIARATARITLTPRQLILQWDRPYFRGRGTLTVKSDEIIGVRQDRDSDSEGQGPPILYVSVRHAPGERALMGFSERELALLARVLSLALGFTPASSDGIRRTRGGDGFAAGPRGE